VIDAEARAVRITGVARNVLSSDLGRVDGPFPDTGLAQFIREFAQRGFTEEELRQMTVLTPRALAG